MVRVMLVDDSIMFREFLKSVIAKEPELEVVGSFGDPVEAINHIKALQPDVITVDMEMPKMRGSEFLRNVLPGNPGVKAIVISALSGNVFDAMQAGAIDFVAKPGFQPDYGRDQFAAEIVKNIKVAAGARIRFAEPRPAPPALTATPRPRPTVMPAGHTGSGRALIAIGASTGGTEAIVDVVRNFPATMPPVAIVQHMPSVFTKMFADRLNGVCAMAVREARDGDRLETGVILVAPGGDKQMRVMHDRRGYSVTLRQGEKVSGHCPSVDVLFESVEKAAGSAAVGVILTGMGADGARGLAGMRRAGAHTFGQDEESCVVYGMPKVAFELGGIAEQLPLSAIGAAVQRRFGK